MTPLSAADEAMVCRYDVLFYPGEKFTSVSDNLIDELKANQAAVAPSPPYIPDRAVTDAASTSGPPPLAAPTNAGARTAKAMDDALFSAAELLQGRGRDRRRIVLIVSDGRNQPKLNHHTYDKVVELLLRDNISVYSLAHAVVHHLICAQAPVPRSPETVSLHLLRPRKLLRYFAVLGLASSAN